MREKLLDVCLCDHFVFPRLGIVPLPLHSGQYDVIHWRPNEDQCLEGGLQRGQGLSFVFGFNIGHHIEKKGTTHRKMSNGFA